MVATTVAKNGKVTLAKVGVTLKAGQRRLGATLDRRKNRRATKAATSLLPRTSMYRQERGQVTPGTVAVEIPDFTGRSSDPEWNAVRRGLNDMLTTDVLTQADKCAGKVVVVEVDRRGDIIKELEFQRSRYVDPATRSQRNFIIGDVVVRGTTSDVPGSPGAGIVTVQIVDKASGEVLGTVTKRVNPNSFFDDMDALGKRVGEELCKLSDVYEVTVDLASSGIFATHDARATLRAVIKARRGTGAENLVWRGTATASWQNPVFVSKVPGCTYVDPVSSPLELAVEIRLTGPETLTVTWDQTNGTSTATNVMATVVCENGSVPGQPGTSLVGAVPFTFTVPVAGGSVAAPNGVTDGGEGFFNAGTIKVTPRGAAGRR